MKTKFSEQFSLKDLDSHAVSDLTASFLWDRQHDGIDDFKLKSLSISKVDMLLTFTASPTHVIGHSVDNFSVDGKVVRQKGYSTQLDFLEPENFLGSSQTFNSFSEKERSQLLSDFIHTGMAKVHCTCGAYNMQGAFEAMSSHDSDIYKYQGPKGTGIWKARHSKGLTEGDIMICKHLASIIEQIDNYIPDILKALSTKNWVGTATQQPQAKPEEKPKKEPVLDTADIKNKEEEEKQEQTLQDAGLEKEEGDDL